jgi:hypothetical protein
LNVRVPPPSKNKEKKKHTTTSMRPASPNPLTSSNLLGMSKYKKRKPSHSPIASDYDSSSSGDNEANEPLNRTIDPQSTMKKLLPAKKNADLIFIDGKGYRQ